MKEEYGQQQAKTEKPLLAGERDCTLRTVKRVSSCYKPAFITALQQTHGRQHCKYVTKFAENAQHMGVPL